MRKEYESIEWDKERGGIVITKQEYINMQDASGIDEVKKKLRAELEAIVRQAKNLKCRAFEIKALLDKLEGKAGPIDPAP